MKYVRTKDGTIYQVYDKVFEYKGDKRYQLADSRFEISLNTIVKEANTIEELCDELVIKYKNEEKPRYVDMTELLKTCKNIGVAFRKHIKWLFAHYKDQLELCRLAIWTDDGLTYVTKPMTKEGKVELL